MIGPSGDPRMNENCDHILLWSWSTKQYDSKGLINQVPIVSYIQNTPHVRSFVLMECITLKLFPQTQNGLMEYSRWCTLFWAGNKMYFPFCAYFYNKPICTALEWSNDRTAQTVLLKNSHLSSVATVCKGPSSFYKSCWFLGECESWRTR